MPDQKVFVLVIRVQESHFSHTFFFFWQHLWHVEVHGPGIKPVPQQQPKLLLWQRQILNLLGHQGTPVSLHFLFNFYLSFFLTFASDELKYLIFKCAYLWLLVRLRSVSHFFLSSVVLYIFYSYHLPIFQKDCLSVHYVFLKRSSYILNKKNVSL